MSTAVFDESTTSSEMQVYRAMSPSAVVGLVLGLLSSLMLAAAQNGLGAAMVLAPLPLVGIFLSWRAWRRIRETPDELAGKPLAIAGLALSTIFLVVGVGQAAVVYFTEVPEGYARISFVSMRPDEVEERTGKVVPDDIMALDGEEVFIKGYMRPSARHSNLKSFLLVRDNEECCFGDISKVKYFDQMQVRLESPLLTDYSTRLFRVGGRLKIRPEFARPNSSQPVFELVADHLK